jgi:hypothetical protein
MKEETAKLAGDTGLWPMERQFIEAGLRGMHTAIRRYGLRDRLLQDLGLQLRTSARGHRRTWTDADISANLERLIGELGTWPTVQDFHRAGLGGLYNAMRKRKTQVGWARHFGFEPPRRGRPPARQLTSPI